MYAVAQLACFYVQISPKNLYSSQAKNAMDALL